MNSHERVLTALSGGTCDRVPVGPFIGYRAASEAGFTLKEYYTDGDKIAEAQLAVMRKVGHDIAVTAADTYYISEAFGMETEHHDNALPTVKRPLFSALQESRKLHVPNPETDGRMPVYLQAVERMKELIGNKAAVRGTGTGPFSLAAYLFGESEFLMHLADIELGYCDTEDEKSFRMLMEITSDTTIAFLKAQIARGVDIAYMGDSFASAEMISPEFYRNYVFPYHKKVFEEVSPMCRQYGAYTLLHICGDNRAVFRDFAATGVDIIEIDHKVPLGEAREIIGKQTALIGNLDPVHVLLKGSPDTVYRIAEAAMQELQTQKGQCGKFILGSGCFVPLGTPIDNLRAMVTAAERFAEIE